MPPVVAFRDSEFPTNYIDLKAEISRIHDYRYKLEPIVCETSKLYT